MGEGLGEPIIRDVTLEEGVLHIESDNVDYIGPVDSSKGIVSHNLVAHSIRSYT